MNKIDSYCGLDCSTCEYREKMNCSGCIATNGCPPWVTETKRCEVADCVNGKKVEGNSLTFCGECANFPCEIVTNYSNNPEHGDTPKGARIERCRKQKTEKVALARENLSCEVAVCGLHCDYCFLGEWCGGCRSPYNCCSYATLFPDKKCPNVVCTEKRGFTEPEQGCWNCSELKTCLKGFYDGKHGIQAKATALFISKYGLDSCRQMLKNAIAQEVDYNTAFNKCDSIDEAVALMETYMA